MTGIEVTTLLLQFVVPVVLVARVALARRRTPSSWVVDTALAASYLAAITLAGLWLALPGYLPWVYLILLLGSVVIRVFRSDRGGDRSPGRLDRFGLGFRVALIVLSVAVSLIALSGRRPFDEAAIDLEFPLREGTYLVASGGSNLLVNFHLETRTGERYRSYRGQSYAVDLVKVGRWGSRMSGFSPDAPSGFAIFGDSLHAPCSGTVVRAVDGHTDQFSSTRPQGLEGNHVILDCNGTWIVLAHMKQGSVRVSEGDEVRIDEVLGVVGNSGASGEPHLHIHAQTPGTAEAPLGGQPLPVTFDGRHLVRNDRVVGS
jgi:hypothetical protein